MPSPPDVILVLSPRMAKANRRMLQFFLNGEEITDADFLGADVAGDWPKGELPDALDALIDEIGEQLQRDKPLAPGSTTAFSPTRDEDSDVARIADKMAKAARGAVEPSEPIDETMGGHDGTRRAPDEPEAE